MSPHGPCLMTSDGPSCGRTNTPHIPPADVEVPRRLFASIQDRIGGLRRPRHGLSVRTAWRVDAVGNWTGTVRPGGPDPGEGRGRVRSRRRAFVTPVVTGAGNSLSGVNGSIPMRLGIDRMRQPIEWTALICETLE